jgi:hypothetical protein
LINALYSSSSSVVFSNSDVLFRFEEVTLEAEAKVSQSFRMIVLDEEPLQSSLLDLRLDGICDEGVAYMS